MKILAGLLALASCAFAQNPLTETVMARFHTIRQNLVGAAEAMPDDSYDFKLSPEQRPFSGWIGHTAVGNYMFCSAIKGEKAPDTSAMHAMTSKADLVKAMKDSFEFCEAALEGMTDTKALAPVNTGGKQSYPVQSMVALIASGNEHYGNLVGYLRVKGITPPSSRKK